MDSRQAQKSPPSVLPRSARWNAWLWALTKPGSGSRAGTARRYHCLDDGHASRSGPARADPERPHGPAPRRHPRLRRPHAPNGRRGKLRDSPCSLAAAAATDQIDGYLARRWHVESEFGKFADPLADRLMIDAAVLLLCLDDRLPWLALAIVLGRDALLIGGYRLRRRPRLRVFRLACREDRHLGALRGHHRRDRLRQGRPTGRSGCSGPSRPRSRRGRPLRRRRPA